MVKAKLIALTQPTIETKIPDAESLVAYCARVSNPSNQDSHDTSDRLLRYCIRNRHWSVFEMANAIIEVEAPRDITRQFLRHRSFSFQEFSQRYSSEIGFCDREVRAQDSGNRQNSLDILSEEDKMLWKNRMDHLKSVSETYYQMAITQGIAKECARVMLPEGLTISRVYANGTMRSWLHYLEVRLGNGTQVEHTKLAEAIRDALRPAFPQIMELTDAIN